MSAAESWFAASAVAEPLPKARPRRSTPATAKPRARQRQPQRRSLRVRASLVWMLVFALLLVGVVAVNVAVLRAHVSVTNLDKEIAQRQQKIATLKSQYARATAAPRIAAAAARSGDILAPSTDTSLLDMVPRK